MKTATSEHSSADREKVGRLSEYLSWGTCYIEAARCSRMAYFCAKRICYERNNNDSSAFGFIICGSGLYWSSAETVSQIGLLTGKRGPVVKLAGYIG